MYGTIKRVTKVQVARIYLLQRAKEGMAAQLKLLLLLDG
jgi:hypothetical protein